MSAKKKPTLLKTIRISESIDNLLKKDAASKKTSTNALIQAILTRYLEWDCFAEKYGFISVTQDTFKTILYKIEDEKLVEASNELGTRVPKDILLFWFGKTGVSGFLKYLTLLSDYATFADFEIAREGPTIIVTAHHNLGAKWSNYPNELLRDRTQKYDGNC